VNALLRLADWSLHALHVAVMLFCVTGWIFPETRSANLAVVALIAASWFVLGIFRGFGYCAITDLQWRIKKRLGRQPATDSFVKYQFDWLTRRDLNPRLVDGLTQLAFYLSAAASIYLSAPLRKG
jgi:Protein of Unknown function (DUF2784)